MSNAPKEKITRPHNKYSRSPVSKQSNNWMFNTVHIKWGWTLNNQYRWACSALLVSNWYTKVSQHLMFFNHFLLETDLWSRVARWLTDWLTDCPSLSAIWDNAVRRNRRINVTRLDSQTGIFGCIHEPKTQSLSLARLICLHSKKTIWHT